MMEVKNCKEKEAAELKEIKKERQKTKRGSRKKRQKRNKRNPVREGTKQTGEKEVQANEAEEQGLSGQKRVNIQDNDYG